MELLLALALGLRHASDPDHLVAVTSLMSSEDADSRRAVELGAWWGMGHAAMLLVIGLPLIAFKSELPAWLEGGAETAVGVVIVVLAARVLWRWIGGPEGGPGVGRTPHQAFGVGVLHGLAGTGAVVLLLVAAVETQVEAAAALAVFAPMSIVSMATLTGGFAWILTRPVVDPICRIVLIPALGLSGVAFGLAYSGLM